MAKRRQTTGLPRKSSTGGGRRSEYKSRHEREAEMQRYILIGTGVAVAAIILILVVAVVVQLVITPNRAVATVNGETITVSQFEERVRLERAILNARINNFASLLSAQGLDLNQFASQEPLRTWLSEVQIPDQLGNTVINSMVDDALVRQKAKEMGITVTDADIEKQLNQFIGFNPTPPPTENGTLTPTVEPTVTRTPFVSPTPSPVPTSTPTAEATVEATAEATAESTAEATQEVSPTPTYTPFPPTSTPTYDEQVAQADAARQSLISDLATTAKISQDRVKQYFEMLALRTALRDATSTLTNQAPFVNARHILVNTEEEAQDVLAALEAGESFADLARASSIDTGSGQKGGELGWAATIDFVAPFADAAKTAEIGALVGPIQTDFGWHILQVRAREMREVTDTQLNTAKDQEFKTWLDNLRKEDADSIQIYDIWADNIPSEPAFSLNSGASSPTG